MRDSVKSYLTMAGGVTTVTRDRATVAARQLVNQGGVTAGQVQALAEELVSQSKSNREAIIALVRYEVDRALGRVGLASSDEVAALRARVRTLEAHLRTAEAMIATLTDDGATDSASTGVAAKASVRTPLRAAARTSAGSGAGAP